MYTYIYIYIYAHTLSHIVVILPAVPVTAHRLACFAPSRPPRPLTRRGPCRVCL